MKNNASPITNQTSLRPSGAGLTGIATGATTTCESFTHDDPECDDFYMTDCTDDIINVDRLIELLTSR